MSDTFAAGEAEVAEWKERALRAEKILEGKFLPFSLREGLQSPEEFLRRSDDFIRALQRQRADALAERLAAQLNAVQVVEQCAADFCALAESVGLAPIDIAGVVAFKNDLVRALTPKAEDGSQKDSGQ